MAAGLMGDPHSAGHLLDLIRSGRAHSRSELRDITTLSRATIAHRLDRLFRAGWLVASGTGTSTGGRPAARLAFDTAHAAVLVADLEPRCARVAVTDLAGRVLAEDDGELVVADGPVAVLDRLGRWFAELLNGAGVAAETVCGIGLAVTGPVDWATGRVVAPPIMPGWDGFPIREQLREAFAEYAEPRPGPRIPVLVDNDANLMALAEQRRGHPDCAAFALVKVSTGIGAGMIIDGGVYRGIDGGSGDIGHVIFHGGPKDTLCTCGSFGCLATVAGGSALAQQLAAKGLAARTNRDVRALLAAGQPDAVRLAREAGRRLGEVLATVVTLLNPGVLVIAGSLADTHYITGIRESLYQYALPRATRHLHVATSELGEHAALAGAAAMVVDHLYGPVQADRRLDALETARTAASAPAGRKAGDPGQRRRTPPTPGGGP